MSVKTLIHLSCRGLAGFLQASGWHLNDGPLGFLLSVVVGWLCLGNGCGERHGADLSRGHRPPRRRPRLCRAPHLRESMDNPSVRERRRCRGLCSSRLSIGGHTTSDLPRYDANDVKLCAVGGWIIFIVQAQHGLGHHIDTISATDGFIFRQTGQYGFVCQTSTTAYSAGTC